MEILIQGLALITVAYFAVMFWIDVARLIGSSVRETWLAMETRPPPTPRSATCGPGMIARHPGAASPAAARGVARSLTNPVFRFSTAASCRQGVFTHEQQP